MGYGYSLDLRRKIIEAAQSSGSARAAARRFGVSASCAITLVGRWRRTGSYTPGQVGGQKKRKLADHSPRSAVVWTGIRYADGCAADSLCTVMAFFCSGNHLVSWRSVQVSQTRGYRLFINEGLQMGRAIFAPRLFGTSANA